MTGLLVALGLGGNPQLAADVGIIQGTALALFFAFSANARNLILKSGAVTPVRSIMMARLMLMLPLGAGVYYLGSVLGSVAWDISLILILRKIVEWLSEIHLSEAERDQDSVFAWRHLVIQSGLLVTAAVWAITETPGLMLVLTAWALVPLLISIPYLRRVLRGAAAKRFSAGLLLPHFGSTAVMGIGVYVFRLTILLLVDKVIAGNLYTAYAIGGFLGSIYAMGVGPSLVLQEQKTGQKHMPVWLRVALVLAILAGLAVTAISHFWPDTPGLEGKDMLFWHAIGFSLIGGVVMVFAQRQRLRDLQHGTQDDVFAPDVLVNMLIVIFIPTIFFAFGQYGLSWLYLFNAVVALVFYWMTDTERATSIVRHLNMNMLRIVLAVLLVIPIFVNLETGLFRSVDIVYDSGGVFRKLPMPLSVFACYAGIAILGNYRRANLGLAIIFGSFALMVLSTVATTIGSRFEEQGKLILLAQYILPMFGLVLGMMYEEHGRDEHLAAKGMLLVIAALIPIQLLASWMQGQTFLTPYLYLFSVYQHFQYVPVIVASIYIVALFSLWNSRSWRMLILVLVPLVGIYVAAAGSMLAVVFLLIGCAAFAVHRVGIKKGGMGSTTEWVLLSFVLVAGTAYHFWAGWTMRLVGAGGSAGVSDVGLFTQKFSGSTMLNVQSRFDIWQYYLHGIFSDLATFLFGHGTPPDRKMWASAHNYYLDFIYNFGAIAALVIIGLIVFTVIRLYRNRHHVTMSPATTGLAVVVLLLLILDNLLKVGMRQPYSGIVTFFLWGLLLARIESLPRPDKQRPRMTGAP